MELAIFLLNNICWFIFFYLFSKEKIPYDELPKVNIKSPFKKKEQQRNQFDELTDIPLKEIIKKKIK